MRLAFSILGTEVFAVELGTADDEDEYVDCGSTTSMPVGFTRPDIPWDADGPVHQFEPDGSDEDT